MAKLNENAAQELPLNDEKAPAKKNRHVVIALNHLRKRQLVLLDKQEALAKEIDEVENGILALS